MKHEYQSSKCIYFPIKLIFLFSFFLTADHSADPEIPAMASFFLAVWDLHAAVHHFHRIAAAVVVERHHGFAPAGVHAHAHAVFVHFRHAGHHVVLGHFHHHVDGVTSHGVTGDETTDHLHSARFAETFAEFLHEHVAVFHGHARHGSQGEAHHDHVRFFVGHAHGHHGHALHDWAGDFVDALVAHGDHVAVLRVHTDVRLAFHGGHGVREFHHHHEHGRATQAHLPLTHALGSMLLPHHLALRKVHLPHVAAVWFHLVHAHHVALHHVGGHRHFRLIFLG